MPDQRGFVDARIAADPFALARVDENQHAYHVRVEPEMKAVSASFSRAIMAPTG